MQIEGRVVGRRFTVEEYHKMGEAVERHNDPRDDGYRHVERARPGEELVSQVLPALVIPVVDAMGK